MKRIAIVTSFLGLLVLLFTFNGCQKEYSVETGVSLAAQGSLWDTTGNCMHDSVVGTFYDGVTPNGTLATGADTAYVLVKVNVASTGSFNITSNIVNGVYFSDSGYFTSTGIDTVRLYPVGTPILPGIYTYTISFDSTTCTFTVPTLDSTGRGLGGSGGTSTNPNLSDTAWKFTSPTGSFSGIIDTAYQSDSAGVHYLALVGTTTGDSVFYAGVAFTGGAITPGNYSTQSSGLFRFYDAVGNVIYAADPTVSGVNVVITIISYDATTKIVTATFSGTAKNASGNIVNITSGSFTVQTS